MTLSQAKAELAKIGYSVRKITETGEYRVVRKGGTEASAYYTNNLADAVATGKAESLREAL